MIRQWLQLLLILLDPRVTRVPLRVLRELRQHGKPRLPLAVEKGLNQGIPRLHALQFIRHWLAGERLSRHRGQWVVNSFLPPFPGPAFDRMFENLLSGRRLSPVSAFLAVTADCPYACWHCSLKQRAAGNLPTADWLRIMQDVQELGASLIGFTGGEPLLRPDLPELVAAAARGGAATILFTSGAGFDAAMAEHLRRAGLWAFCISLDHPDPAAVNTWRGHPQAYECAINAIRLARSCGFYTMTGTVATRALIEGRHYEPLYALARSLGVHEFRLIEPMPCGLLSETGPETLLTPEHIAALRRFHVTVNRRGRLPKVCAFNQVESPEFFGCGAGTQHLFIDSAGNVCPCDFTPLGFGNVTRQPLAGIWNRMTAAMGNPRRHCFIQQHHGLVAGAAAAASLSSATVRYPLTPEQSEIVCARAGSEPLPDYFALVTGGQECDSRRDL